MVRREKLGRKDTYMYQTRKIGVVGQGHVGAHVANSLLMQALPMSCTCAISTRPR